MLLELIAIVALVADALTLDARLDRHFYYMHLPADDPRRLIYEAKLALDIAKNNYKHPVMGYHYYEDDNGNKHHIEYFDEVGEDVPVYWHDYDVDLNDLKAKFEEAKENLEKLQRKYPDVKVR